MCKFIGGKRVNYTFKRSYETRCEAASICFNAGSGEYHRAIYKAVVNKSPSAYIKKYIEKIKRRQAYYQRIQLKRRRLFKKKEKHVALPDEDYGPEASLDPDMPLEQYEHKKTCFLNDLEKTEQQIQDLEK